VAQTQQTVPKWLICNELQNKHPPHSGEAAQNCANIWHFYGSADFVYVFWFNKYGVVASS
jgi:hypothetical protein